MRLIDADALTSAMSDEVARLNIHEGWQSAGQYYRLLRLVAEADTVSCRACRYSEQYMSSGEIRCSNQMCPVQSWTEPDFGCAYFDRRSDVSS